MFLFLKWYFVAVFVIDAKRLSLLHARLTGEDREAFVLKNQLPRHVFGAVIYLHLFAIALCTNPISSLPQWSLAQEGEGKASQSLRWPGTAGAAPRLAVVSAGLCCGSLFWYGGKKSLWEEKRGPRNLPSWCMF